MGMSNSELIKKKAGEFLHKAWSATVADIKTALSLGSVAYTALTDYVTHALATAANDFLVASGSGVWVKKTLAETKVILGLVAGTTGTHTCKTVKYTIGNVGVAGCNANFATAADKAEQVMTLANIVPARARIVDVFTITEAAFTNLGAFVAETGITSSGAELIASNTIAALNAITAMAHAGAELNPPVAAASSIYVSATPANNWNSANPVGKVSIYITYIDVNSI
jgi:hypothetical protein